MASSELQRVHDLVRRKRSEAGHREDLLDVGVFRKYMGDWGLLQTQGLHIREHVIDGLHCRWVWQDGCNDRARVVYLHGGGYVAGDWLSHGSLAAGLARAAGLPVLFVDYRLAPEHRFPAALDDTLTAYEWALDNGASGPGRAAGVFLAGDSAGGGLAVAGAIELRDRGGTPPRAIVALGAFFNLDVDTSSLLRESGLVRGMARAYAGDTPATHPLLSPLYADLRGLPPVLLQVGDADYLLEDSLELRARLERAHVDVTLDLWPEMPHVWQKFEALLPEARQAQARIAAYLHSKLSSP